MTDDDEVIDRSPRGADEIRVRERLALGVLAVFGVFHAWASWRYAGPMWTEHGDWLHAVDRIAGGEVPYRDFEWRYPPAALWLTGFGARLTGTSLAGISAVTVVVYFAVLALFFGIVRRLTREVALPVTIATLLFTTGYAARTSTPLPLGTGNLTIPVAVMFLLAGGLLLHSAVQQGARGAAAAAGAMLGLCMMSAYQFWGTALFLVILGVVLLRGQAARGSASLLAAFAATLAVVFAITAITAGSGVLLPMLTGFGVFPQHLLASQPTMERFTIEIAAVAAITLTAVCALWLCLAIGDRTAGRWGGIALLVFLAAAAAHLGTTVAKGTQLTAAGPEQWPTRIEVLLSQALLSGRPLLKTALAILDFRFQRHLFPVLLPIFLLIVVRVRWRAWADPALRNLVAMLLGLCLATRLSLGFQGSEWYNVLLEIPTFVLMLRLGGAGAIHQAGRAVLAALAMMILLGMYAYASMARGPLTFRGVLPATVTARGAVRWHESELRDYVAAKQLLDAADAGGQRPLLAWGPTGRWNYFLGRPNPTRVREGLFLLGAPYADSLIATLPGRRPAVLLLEHVFVVQSVPARFAPWYWEPVMGPPPAVAFDSPRFARLLAACPPTTPADSTTRVRVHDCDDR